MARRPTPEPGTETATALAESTLRDLEAEAERLESAEPHLHQLVAEAEAALSWAEVQAAACRLLITTSATDRREKP